MSRRPDRRSPEARAWRRLYWTAEWKALRSSQLAREPLCERCREAGFVTAATTVNHRIPHKGDRARFRDPANLQSVCAACHDGPIQAEERSGRPNGRVGYRRGISERGLPEDPRHPFFAGGADRPRR